MSTKTFQPTTATVDRKWHLIDAKGQVLGRIACDISKKLLGKSKRIFAPHVDCGDYVVVLNVEGIRITGNNKATQKTDFRHSGYPGGKTITPYGEFMRKNPERALSLAVTGMLPKSRLRSRMMARLRVFKGTDHPHFAQFATKPVAEVKA